MDNRTIDYYNQNIDKFVSDTKDVEFTSTQDLFLSYLKEGTSILDLGCGSGRDTKYFLSKGYNVSASDGSIEICKAASAYSGIEVKHQLFNDLDDYELYDGIWACSSILHLNRKMLVDAFGRINKALKADGILYTSFKYSEYEGMRNGRYFIDFTIESFREFMKEINGFAIEKEWVSSDVRPGRSDERWLNLIMRKINEQ